MTDEMALLRGLRPSATDPDPEVVARERDALLSLIARAPTPNRHRGVVGIAGAGLIALATAAAGWAVISRDPALSTTVTCPEGEYVEVETGDPVADCAAAWREETGSEPPPLRAYADVHGDVYVIEASEQPLDDWRPLDPWFRQDPRVRQLVLELSDVGRGFESGCFSQRQAVDLVSSQFERLGMDDWTVRVARQAASDQPVDPGDCATYFHHRDDENPRQIVIRAAGPGDLWGGPPTARELSRNLYAQMTDRCMTLDEAAALARSESERLGFKDTQVDIDTLTAPGSPRPTCARPVVWVGGVVGIVLRETPTETIDSSRPAHHSRQARAGAEAATPMAGS